MLVKAFTIAISAGIFCTAYSQASITIPLSPSSTFVAPKNPIVGKTAINKLIAIFEQENIKFTKWISNPRSVKMAFVEYNQETAFLKCPTRPDSFRRENKAFELIEAAQPDKYGVGNNIVRRLHSFSREGIECFVLSLGGDVTLKEYASSNGINYDGDTLAPLIGQLLKAVRFLHDHAGIVHGDIKPDNILVRLTSPPQITLIDFDLSYVKGERILTTGLSHAPAYVPPEGLSDEYPEHEDKHDVWALGVTIFNVLTGKDILENRINPIMNVKVVLASQKRRSSSFKAFRKALSGDFKKAQNDDFKDNLTYKQAIKEMQLCLQTTPALRLSLAEIDAKKNEPIETKKL